MYLVVVLLFAVWLIWLAVEAEQARRARRRISHIVHVNGTRGKSTVCRLIEAGMRASGRRTFCKTTGTDPMTIDVEGREEPIHRRGPTNIREQLAILKRAAEQGAEVLVVECMAIRPELQFAAQHQILRADVGVITNVRRDHTDVMGDTPEEICDALCNTIPRNGALFTAERAMAPRMEAAARRAGCRFQAVYPAGDEPDFDFPENIALALAVCQYLGADRGLALEGMRRYRRDPYALSLYRLHGGLLINGLSINDVQSTCMVWRELSARYKLEGKRLILLVNNRADRGSRTQDMLRVCSELAPLEVWLLGASLSYMKRGLRRMLPTAGVRVFLRAAEVDFSAVNSDAVLFAVGNLAGEGRTLIARMKEEGEAVVQ